MVKQGVAPGSQVLRAAFLQHVADIFEEATLANPPEGTYMQRGGKQGRHSERLGYILAEMQFLQRAYPGAEW
jgi:ring-1,2-phenylacetyl-CoA epoxidase subunit PaaC